MRIVAAIALACAVGLFCPSIAQSQTADTDSARTSSVAKRSPSQVTTVPQPAAPVQTLQPSFTTTTTRFTVPDRLSPPESAAPVAPAPHPVSATPAEPLPSALEPEQVEQPAPPQAGAFSSPERFLEWLYNYRKHPTPARVPAAVRAMRDLGLFQDEEKAAFCTGFIAGVIGENPKAAASLIAKMFPMPDKDQAVIIRAIAFSGRPDWRDLMAKFQGRMKLRQPLIDSYVSGQAKPLMLADLDSTTVIYALWGYYVATDQHEPVVRIIQALQYSKSGSGSGFSWKKITSGWRQDPSAVEKISAGATAKWTLASYAERDRELLSLYRAEYDKQPPEIAAPLKDVIEAAEVFESEKVRKDQLSAIEEAQKQKATNEAGMSKAATAGSIAIATGCVAASALGQVYVAVPCVIGGALYTGAVKLMH